MKTIELNKPNFQESKGRIKDLDLSWLQQGNELQKLNLFWHNNITANQQQQRNSTCNQGTLRMSKDYVR